MTGDVKMQTAARLDQALKSGRLSSSAEEIAGQCLKRMESPLRLSVLGTNPIFTNRLLNMLVGSKVVDPNAGHVTMQVLHNDRPAAVAIYADETRKTYKDDEIALAFEGAPSRVRIGYDLPSLKKVSFLRVTADTTAGLAQSIRWSILPSDVVLWCGDEFGLEELSIWQALPQRIRDHSYLVQPLTGQVSADTLAESGFVDLLRIDPRAAMAARERPNGVDKTAFKNAGGTEIVRTIKKEIELSQQAALDAAQVILLRHANELEGLPEPAPFEPYTPQSTFEDTQAPAAKVASKSVTQPPLRVVSSSQHFDVSKRPPPPQEQPSAVTPVAEETKDQPDPVVLKALNRVRSRQLNAEKVRQAGARASQAQSATPWSLGLEDIGQQGAENARKKSLKRPVSQSRTRPISRLRAPIDPPTPSQPRSDRVLSQKTFTSVVEGLTTRANALESEIDANDTIETEYLIEKAQECVEWGRTFFDEEHLSDNEDVQMIRETLDEMDEILILMSIEADTNKTDVAKLLKQAAREVEFYLGA